MFELFPPFTNYPPNNAISYLSSEELSEQELESILNSSCNKRESNQYFPAGMCFYKSNSSANEIMTLSHPFLKIGKEIYQITNPNLKQGGQGSINEISKLSAHTKRLAKKINAAPNIKTESNHAFLDALLEIEALKAAGLYHGHVIHIEPNADAPFLYQLQVFIIMDDLGEDLHTYLNREAPLSEFQQFDLAIQCFWLLAQCHMGLLFSSGKRIHRDLKPKNITIKNNKLSIIDWGLSQQINTPNMQVEADRGSRPYIKFPVEEYMEDYDVSINQVPASIWNNSKRSGELFDEDAMCKILYEPLCMDMSSPTRKGIFTDETYHKYNLKPGINTFYDYMNGQYLEEKNITFRGAVNRTVFLIAKQAKCSDEYISYLINTPDLALAVIDVYMSKKDKWPIHGANEISKMIASSEQELKKRAFFVKVGLCGHVERALKDQHLYSLLTQGNNTEEQQRAIACLFVSDLWDEPEIYVKKILANETLAARTLDAFFTKEDYELLKLYCREQIPSIVKQAPGKLVHILGEEVTNTLKHIWLEKEEIELLLKHKREIVYLYNFYNSVYQRETPFQLHQVNFGVLLQLFATKPSYRNQLMEFLELRHLSLLENIVKQNLRKLIDLDFEFDNKIYKKNLTSIKVGLLKKLFTDESISSLTRLVEFNSNYSSIELKKILDIKQKNPYFYNLLFTNIGIDTTYFNNNTNQRIDLSYKIIKSISLDSFFYNAGFENEKIQTLEYLLKLPMLEHKNPFTNEALIKCGVIFHSQRLSLKDSMPLMLENKHACQVLAEQYDALYNGKINLSAYRLAKIYKNNGLYSMNLQANQWDLNFVITQITKLLDIDDRIEQLISLFINLYKQLSAFRKKLATFENRSSTLIRFALQLDQINDEIKSNLNATPKKISSASFLSLLSTSTNELKTFIDKPDVRNAIKNSNCNFQPFWFKAEASPNKISNTLTKINKTLSSINNIDDENLIPIALSHRVKPQNNNMSYRNNAKVFAWH